MTKQQQAVAGFLKEELMKWFARGAIWIVAGCLAWIFAPTAFQQ